MIKKSKCPIYMGRGLFFFYVTFGMVFAVSEDQGINSSEHIVLDVRI